MANLITIVRFPLILIYLIILYFWRSSSAALAWNVPLIMLIFSLDVIDGWVARKRGEASLLGSVLDIATDRTLYTGFANRDVPLTCLKNPSNVSVKVLRKFIHVKFVTKIDLKRMAQDKAGVRRELRQEIEKYLDSLA